MNKIRKNMIVCLVMALLLISMSVSASENNVDSEMVSIETIDSLLREAGTPENKILSMDDELKRFIYDNSLSRNKVEYIEAKQEQGTRTIAALGDYEISDEDLAISVDAFKVIGENRLDIYPSYEWKIPVQPKGKDYFGYATSTDYSAIPGARSNLIWSKMEGDDAWTNNGPATYTGSSLLGYQHSGSSLGSPDFPLYIKGNFYFGTEIKSSSPDKKIVMAYVHDTSSGGVSYSVSYGPISIGIVSSSSNVGHLNNLYDLKY